MNRLEERRDIHGLIRALKHKDLDIQWQAADVLVKLGGDYIDLLVQELKNRNKDIRLGIIEVLGEIRDPRALEPLLGMLEDRSNEVRLQAALALGELGDPRAIEYLIRLLRNPDKYVRYGAALALDKLEWNPSDPSLLAFLYLGKQDWDKLSSIGEPAIEALSIALNDTDSTVRSKAVDVLGTVGGGKTELCIPSLYRSLRDENDDVRWQAVLSAPNCGIAPHYIPRGLKRRAKKRKNPRVAAFLNFLLPGMGYMYLGYWWGVVVFQIDVTATVYIFRFSGELMSYLVLYPIYALLAIHAAFMAKKLPDL